MSFTGRQYEPWQLRGWPCPARVSEFGTLLAIDRARKVLGFEPRHTWRNHIPAEAHQKR
jgi:hypothetical protein